MTNRNTEETNDLPREVEGISIFHPDWGTVAYMTYSANIVQLDALLAMVFPLLEESAKSERYLTARRLQVENDYSGPWAIKVNPIMLSWQVVMRVSAVEVYLQDVLTLLALFDPEFIRSRGSKQEWDYDIIREAADGDNVVWSFCDRWARAFIGDGGPAKWSKSLERSGLGKFDDQDIQLLETMWGYRHLRVHHGGRFTREFVRRHPDQTEKLSHSNLSLEGVQLWWDAAKRFVDGTEKGIMGRLRGRLGEAFLEENFRAKSERQMAFIHERTTQRSETETKEQQRERISRYAHLAQEEATLRHELFGEEGTPPPTFHSEFFSEFLQAEAEDTQSGAK